MSKLKLLLEIIIGLALLYGYVLAFIKAPAIMLGVTVLIIVFFLAWSIKPKKHHTGNYLGE